MAAVMKLKVGLALLAAGLVTGAAAADDVLLTNGESFEGVIAEREGEHVRIRLEFGELRLPAASVARIDHASSALADYLEWRRRLRSEGGTAREWLELSRWARGRGLDHGSREALLEAASLDPHLDGLAPGMRDLDYVFEAALDRWIPYAEHMRRAGLVLHRGEWVRPESRAAEPAADRDPGRPVEEALARTVELLARAELERETRETRQATRPAPAVPYGFPVAHFPGWWLAPAAADPGDGPSAEPAPAAPALPPDLFRRPPGSLLPVGGANSGSRIRQPGSLLPAVSMRR